jgi:predicted nucleic acid-binding protein
LNPKKIVVDTDIILEYLIHSDEGARSRRASVLRRAMSVFFCYTIVFNAIEVFALCETEEEIQAVEDSLSALKILGLNGKSARSVGRVVRQGKKSETGRYDLLIAGVCVESKLPILTGRPDRYRTVKSLQVVPARRLRGYESAAAVESRSR